MVPKIYVGFVKASNNFVSIFAIGDGIQKILGVKHKDLIFLQETRSSFTTAIVSVMVKLLINSHFDPYPFRNQYRCLTGKKNNFYELNIQKNEGQGPILRTPLADVIYTISN